MGVIITPQKEIDAYFESSALGQSTLKKLLVGMGNFLANQEDNKELYYEEKDHFIVGSAVDLLLTGEEEEFDKQYYVSNLTSKPSDAEVSIINMIFDKFIENEGDPKLIDGLIAYDTYLDEAIEFHQWYKGKPGEKRITSLIEKGEEYFQDLAKAHGKQIMTVTQKSQIDSIVMHLKTSPRTSKFFDRETQLKNPTVDFYYQLPIYFEHKGIECKALLDLVVVVKDVEGNIIYVQPIDLKTMHGHVMSFITSLKSRRYDIQAAWYTLAIAHWLSNFAIGTPTIKPFVFIVESSNMPGNPLVYVLKESLQRIGESGREEVKATSDVVIVREIKGYEQLIDDYIFYEDTEWKEERKIAGKDILSLDWNGIVTD